MTNTKPSSDAAPSPPDGNAEREKLSGVLDRNINTLLERRSEDRQRQSTEDRIAAAISRFAGSMPFVYVHVLIFGAWIIANLGLVPHIPRFDPSLVILAMVASVEAIFISTFVMINQNRMAQAEDKRAELSLQISLLSEHETTRLISLVSAIVDHFDIRADVGQAEIEELTRNVPPDLVLEQIERRKQSQDPE